MPEWAVALLSTAVGIILGTFVQEIVFKPVLKVEDEDDEFHSPVDGNWHHRVIVQNVGLRAAENCSASLTLEGITSGDVVLAECATLGTSSFGHEPRDILEEGLQWSAIGNAAAITINKRSRARLDFYFVREVGEVGGVIKLICVHSEKSGVLRVVLKGAREYRGKILITGSNANPREVFFRLMPREHDVGLKITKIRPRLWPPVVRQFKWGQ